MRATPFAGHPTASWCFTTREEGSLATHTGDDPTTVGERRRRVASLVGVDPLRLRFMRQVHGVKVAEASPANGSEAPEADAIVDVRSAFVPVVLTADCLPVLFAATAPDGRTVTAAAHAGRRGLLDGVLQATVRRLRASGAEAIEAVIGPAICGDCYEVPGHMRGEADATLAGISSTTSWGTPSLDLPGAALALLRGLGVEATSTGVCTLESADYFSYRGGDRSDRLAGLAWVRPA